MTSGSSKTGRPSDTSNHTLDRLKKRFQERLISRKCDVEGAPHSSDLNPRDFYLSGYLKENAYQNNPQTFGELKAAIAAKIREIPREEGVREIGNFCATDASLSQTPRRSFGTYSEENITFAQSILDY